MPQCRYCQKKTVSNPGCSIGECVRCHRRLSTDQYGDTNARDHWQCEPGRPDGASMALCRTRTASCLLSCSKFAYYVFRSLSNEECFAMGGLSDQLISLESASKRTQSLFHSHTTELSLQSAHPSEQQRTCRRQMPLWTSAPGSASFPLQLEQPHMPTRARAD